MALQVILPSSRIPQFLFKGTMEYLKQFQRHLENNNLPNAVALWQEYCLSEEFEGEEFKEILQCIKDSSLVTSFGIYIEQALLLWETMKESDLKHEILKLIFDIQTTNEAKLADLALNYLTSRYPQDENFQKKIKLVGLVDKRNFQYSISNFELLTHMKKGNFFIHTGGWGVGEVTEVSILREQVTLEFDYVAGHKEISFANAFKTLIPISKDHFLARRFGNPDEFEEFARKHPVETIHLLLKDLGAKTAGEIKDELADLVIPEVEWAKWWQSTRTKLKKDTFIESPVQLKDPFRLRKNEVPHEERLLKALSKKPDVKTLVEMIYSFLRDFPSAIKNAEFAKHLVQELTEILNYKEVSESEEIQILFILQDLGHQKAQDLGALITRIPVIERVVESAHILAYKKRLLVEIKKFKTDWKPIFAHLLVAIDQNTLRDYMLDELMQEQDKTSLIQKLEEMLESPNISPHAFVWYFQKIMSSNKYLYTDQEGMDRFLEGFFILLHILEPKPEYRELVKRMHALLQSGRYGHVRRIFQNSSLEHVKEILLLSTKCHTLSDHDVRILYSLAEVVHPSIGALKKGVQEEEIDLIWTTQEGYEKIKHRIEQIATVEIIENAREIEVARSHGDLRENSEYKFAQEKRARLQGELKFLSEQMKRMRILTKQDIDTSAVNVGCHVELVNEKGEQTTYTLLGPWDADPEKNILSAQSKIAQELIGLKIGATCTIQGQNWRVEAIKIINCI